MSECRCAFRTFRAGAFTTWAELFQEAADFAGRVGRDNLISISQSEDKGSAVVTVWYWQ
jgi:hypothetical protein